MSYSPIISNPECRRFVAEGFWNATDRTSISSFTVNFERLVDTSWETDYSSPFFEAPMLEESVVEDPEYELFRCAFALGYSVGHLDYYLDEVVDSAEFDDSRLVYRSDQWLDSGPVRLLRPARVALEPLDPLILLSSGVCKGYLGGISVASGLLAVSVH